MRILTNALGISDSGGITVLEKYLNELSQSSSFTVICYNPNNLLNELILKYRDNQNFTFLPFKRVGIIRRLWIENFNFKKIISSYNIDIIYNLTGTGQFFNFPQLIKLQNLMYFSKKLDHQYYLQKRILLWLNQVFLKRIVFLFMYKNQRYFEIQSAHVESMFLEFCKKDGKTFFIKSDIDVSENNFLKPVQYDFSKRIRFLYVVGPHFEITHKNFQDFVKAMTLLNSTIFNFCISITLTQEQLDTCSFWDSNLNSKTEFLGYTKREDILSQLSNNTILVSTSVIETLGLHVIDAIQNGCLAIAPDEAYSHSVYGNDIFFYSLNEPNSIIKTIYNISNLDTEKINLKIKKTQLYLKTNEKTKASSLLKILDKASKR